MTGTRYQYRPDTADMMERQNYLVLFALVVSTISLVIIGSNRVKLKRSLADGMHAATHYGVVLKPGRLMSTADITHLLQGFKSLFKNHKNLDH